MSRDLAPVLGSKAAKTLLRLATLVRDSNDAVIIRNLKGRILTWNRGAERMYGYREAEALRMNIRRLYPKDKRGETRALVRLLSKGRTVPSVEVQRRTKDGRVLDVWLTATGLVDRRGGPLELATTERDITARKRAERELQSLHARVVSGQETERKRLARDLHDGVGQILSGVKFRLESLSGKILAQPGKTRRKIADVGDSLDRAIFEIRRVAQNLMPSELEDLGLQAALVTLCRDVRERLGIPVVVRFSGVPKDADPDLALAFFRVAQETLNNVERHAGAVLASLTLRRKGRALEMTISDDGKGFDIRRRKAAVGRGVGLGSIRERMASLGGTTDLRSQPGLGTKLVVSAPLGRRG
ncbi:PAS domain S-box protein [bacterium]|nr:MAG: PAS domain S-box protein [bacterium]